MISDKCYVDNGSSNHIEFIIFILCNAFSNHVTRTSVEITEILQRKKWLQLVEYASFEVWEN